MPTHRNTRRAPCRTLGRVWLAVCILALTASAVLAAEPSTVVDADLVIRKADVTATATYYPVEIDGYGMEIIAMLAPDGSIRTVFNACQVCFASGRGVYTQEGSDLVCLNCKNHFPSNSLEMARGGCNPVPVGEKNRQDRGDTIVIPKAFLERAKQYFSKL
ncbi:MAG: DUF2318 domain-containing protein [Planctomycetes bacterium]|nr:DUF2318 domain-containing protein [Planctomycetota bacterium]